MRSFSTRIAHIAKEVDMWTRIILGSRHMLRFGSMTVEERFTKIYSKNMWGDTESLSGTFSSLEGSARLRTKLPDLIKGLEVDTFLDIPCGDFNWMEHVDLPVKKYIGADIVQSLIDTNRIQFGNKNREFVYLDMMNENLPEADLIFCRDCFIHFSKQDILKTIENFKRNDTQYLLTTTHPELKKNIDIRTGSWRPINLQTAPFNFPQPLRLLTEYASSNQILGKSMGLWRIADL